VDEWLADGEPSQRFLAIQGIGAMWLDAARQSGASTGDPRWAALRDIERGATALYMVQTTAVRDVAAAQIRYAIMKGLAWRDQLYARPHVRLAADIDILVERAHLDAARARLHTLGFRRAGDGQSAHEETWTRGSADVDLHWDLLAPGRVPVALASDMLGRRVTRNGVDGLCDEDMVALLLMHTAISKYVCCEHSALSRVVDLLRALRELPIDWRAVTATITACELRGAAWATAYWIDLLSAGHPDVRGLPPATERGFMPGAWRRRYLEAWVRRDLPGRLESRFSTLVQIAFTLPMHDSLASAWRAVTARLARHRA